MNPFFSFEIFSEHLWLIAKSKNIYLCHVAKVMASSASSQCSNKRKMCFQTFGQCFLIILDIALQKPENMLKSYLQDFNNRKQNREAPSSLVFYCCFCFCRWSKNYVFFMGKLQYLSIYLRLSVEIQHKN